MPNQQPNMLVSFMPMILLTIPMIVLNCKVAKRKGRSQVLYLILSVIPIVNFFSCLYLISLTDIEVVEKLNSILEKLDK
ncbi:MAG: hypothetical protein JXK07_14215 [Spirochaetes bacterium]|nr:hypothetical protein [Spirochaetota bacterium]MBN2770150.1 hypothetical protein [Spirochaetota bacterium]